MIYAPICIPTLNRFEHLKKCVESLAKCPEAKDTELYIALDYPFTNKYLEGYLKVKEYVKKIEGFKNVVIFRREHNYGPGLNLRTAKMEIFQKYDRVITTEDDNVFSSSFLRYMNMALERYKDVKSVVGVSGYLPPIYTADILGANDCFFYNGFFAYGFGSWRDDSSRMELVSTDRKKNIRLFKDIKSALRIFFDKDYIFSMYLTMLLYGESCGDIVYSANMILNKQNVLCPPKSLVRNIGLDGSGLHSGSVDPNGLMTQEIVDYDFSPNFPESTTMNQKLAQRIDGRRKLSWKGKMVVLLRYVLWLCYHLVLWP